MAVHAAPAPAGDPGSPGSDLSQPRPSLGAAGQAYDLGRMVISPSLNDPSRTLGKARVER